MPFAGIGLHFAFAILCAIHAVRTRQPMYWLIVLFTFPLIGSVVYFFAIYLPNSRLERHAMRAVAEAARVIDPTRDVRAARTVFEDAPTAQNRMRFAAALLESGDALAAAEQYEACLAGPFASDVDIRFGAAHAFVECHRYADALRYLEPLREERPDFRAEQLALLVARALAGLSRNDEARQAFERAVERHDTYEARAEYAIWCYAVGDIATAQRLTTELERTAARWNTLSREMNAHVTRRLVAARDLHGKGGSAGSDPASNPE